MIKSINQNHVTYADVRLIISFYICGTVDILVLKNEISRITLKMNYMLVLFICLVLASKIQNVKSQGGFLPMVEQRFSMGGILCNRLSSHTVCIVQSQT